VIFFERFSKRYWNIKFHTKASRGSRVVPCGQTRGQPDRQTGRHNEANWRFSQFCELAWNENMFKIFSVFFGVLQVIHIKGMDMDTDFTTTTLITGGESRALPRNSQSEIRGDHKKVEICMFWSSCLILKNAERQEWRQMTVHRNKKDKLRKYIPCISRYFVYNFHFNSTQNKCSIILLFLCCPPS